MTTLAIETSTAQGNVAISENGALIFSETFTAERRHSAQLFVVLERALTTISRCDEIVVGLGPGSYSGVRVAIAAAIGLRFGLKARLRGLNSLIAIATAEPHYCCIGDARQSAFYFAEIKNRAVIVEPTLFSETELRALIAEKIARKSDLPILAPAPIPAFPEAQIAHPSAEILAKIAFANSVNHELSHSQTAASAESAEMAVSENLEPIYLRPPHITLPKPIR